MNTKPSIKIELTPEQKEQVQRLTGQEVPQVRLSLEALEERIAPALSRN
jgi:hypothetical protein